MNTPASRIPLNTFAVAFGLAGLAGTWTTAGAVLGIPTVVQNVFWLIALIAWVWLIVAHTVRGARSKESLVSQLRHPAQGPIAALLPIVGMLIGAHLLAYLPAVGTVMIIGGVVVAAAFAGWHLAHWVSGEVGVESIHGGYFLPTVAAGYIAATTLAKLGLHSAAVGAFGVATLFWIIIMTIMMVRLGFRPALPAPLTPTIAIIVAPPGVGGIAWFAINGQQPDNISDVMAASLVVLLVMQLGLLPRYLKIPFSLGFWSFTFPFAAAGSYIIDWTTIIRPPGWQAIDVVVLAAVTLLIGSIAFRSVRQLIVDRRLRVETMNNELRNADRAVEDRHPAL